MTNEQEQREEEEKIALFAALNETFGEDIHKGNISINRPQEIVRTPEEVAQWWAEYDVKKAEYDARKKDKMAPEQPPLGQD